MDGSDLETKSNGKDTKEKFNNKDIKILNYTLQVGIGVIVIGIISGLIVLYDIDYKLAKILDITAQITSPAISK